MRLEDCRESCGFTLIEVLVALTIIAFGLIAVFGQLSQSASAAGRLRDKTLAHWVAMNTVTDLRLRGNFPAVGVQSDDVEMANTRWHYEIKVSDTADDELRRADVTIAVADKPDRPLATAIGFIGQAAKALPPNVAASGWPLLSADGQLTQGESADKPADNATPETKPDKPSDGAAK